MDEPFVSNPDAALAMIERKRRERGCTCRTSSAGQITRFDEKCPAMDWHVGCCRPRTDLHATTEETP